MIKDFFSLRCKNWRTVIILFLFIFHMMGIRFFSGIGYVLSVVILVLLASSIKMTRSRLTCALGIALLASLFQFIKGSNIGYCSLVAFYVINAIFLVFYVQNRDVRTDFKVALKIFVIQAFLSAIIYLIVPHNFLIEIHWSDKMLQNRSLFYVFFYTAGERHMLSFLPLPRIGGWAWEPGCLQLIINLYICLEIFDRVNIKKLILPTFVLVLTASTTGYIVWAINICLYMILLNFKRIVSFIPIAILTIATVVPIMIGNVTNKFYLGKDEVAGSGAIRIRDFYTGIEEVKQYPFFGIDVSDLSNSREYRQLEDAGLKRFNVVNNWRDVYDYAAGGYCNGFFAMHMYWGLLGILFLFSFFKCRLWKQWTYGSNYWYVIPIIISLSLFSEPISNTSFFLFLCFYNLFTKEKRNANIYCYSNI